MAQGCSSGEDTPDSFSTYLLRIENQSQFDIHHVFIFSEDKTYTETQSLLLDGEILTANGGYIDREVTPEANVGYRVTVTRKTNQYSDLNAYTTGDILSISEDSLLTYYDSQFRLSSLNGDIQASFPEYPEHSRHFQEKSAQHSHD